MLNIKKTLSFFCGFFILFFTLISCKETSAPVTDPKDQDAILDEADRLIAIARVTGPTNIFSGEETPDQPKDGGGGDDPLTLDSDNPLLIGRGRGTEANSCNPTMAGNLNAVNTALQKLNRLRESFNVLPQVRTSDVELQRGVVKRLEAEVAEMTPSIYRGRTDPYTQKNDQLLQEKQKLTTLETQYQQRNAKLVEIQQATRALREACSA